MNEKQLEITNNILQSSKYFSIYPSTVERIVADCVQRYGEKRALKVAKNKLHQIWGAYYTTRPDFDKLLAKLRILTEQTPPLPFDQLRASPSPKRGEGIPSPFRRGEGEVRQHHTLLQQILSLHSSTQERLPYLTEFYQQIFQITGLPSSIIDHACGLNPLTFPWMMCALPEHNINFELTPPLPSPKRGGYYRAYDIDSDQINFLNSAGKILGWDQQVKAALGDLLTDKFPPADVVFLFKILPSLEQQQPGCSLQILQSTPAQYLVVSFPTKSMAGKQKGMTNFYSQQFISLIADQPWTYQRLLFSNELVFVVKKN